MINKLSTYVGFAIKSNKIIYGTDNILANKRNNVILASSELSENARKKIESKFEIFLIDSSDFQKIVNNSAIKVISIIDENLANAIKNLLEVQ